MWYDFIWIIIWYHTIIFFCILSKFSLFHLKFFHKSKIKCLHYIILYSKNVHEKANKSTHQDQRQIFKGNLENKKNKVLLLKVVHSSELNQYFTLLWLNYLTHVKISSKILLYIRGFFCVSQNWQKWGKCWSFLICTSQLLRFKKLLIENNTG